MAILRDEPGLNNDGGIVDFAGNSVSFKFKQKITCQTGAGVANDVEIMVRLKDLGNF